MRYSRSKFQNRRSFALLLTVVSGSIGVASVSANGQTHHTPEIGFSASRAGLPPAATDAWYATVLVEKRQTSMQRRFGQPRRHVKHGSGIVVRVIDGRGLAVIATNAHVVTCGSARCSLRVGFSEVDSKDRVRWAAETRVVSMNLRNDLAFIEAEIPDGFAVRAATLDVAEVRGGRQDPFVSIGWPDLTVQKNWSCRPPPNYRDRVKRFSRGSSLLTVARTRLIPDADLLAQRAQVIYHDAAVLPGSSGGPLVDRKGHVFGINTLILCTRRTIHDGRSYLAPEPRRLSDCVPVAVSSREIIDEYVRVYGLRTSPLDLPVFAENCFGRGLF